MGQGQANCRPASRHGFRSLGSRRQGGKWTREFRGARGPPPPHPSWPRGAGSWGNRGVTHSHTEPAHSTLFAQLRSPTEGTRRPLGALTLERGHPYSPEVGGYSHPNRRKQAVGVWLQILFSTNSTETLGLLPWRGSPLPDPHCPPLAAHVVCGSWNMAQDPSWMPGQARGVDPGACGGWPTASCGGYAGRWATALQMSTLDTGTRVERPRRGTTIRSSSGPASCNRPAGGKVRVRVGWADGHKAWEETSRQLEVDGAPELWTVGRQPVGQTDPRLGEGRAVPQERPGPQDWTDGRKNEQAA